jgi:hypothetical protein
MFSINKRLLAQPFPNFHSKFHKISSSTRLLLRKKDTTSRVFYFSYRLASTRYYSSLSSNDEKKKSKENDIDISILKKLSGYLWPSSDKPNASQIKLRIVTSLSLLLASKLVNIQVPFIFKNIIDNFEPSLELTGALAAKLPSDISSIASAASSSGEAAALIPLTVIIGYGVARSTASLCQEARNAIFATVAHDAIRRVSRRL